MQPSPVRRGIAAVDTLDHIFGSFADLAVDPADILPDQAEGEKLEPHKDEQDGKQGEHPLRRPDGPVNESGDDEKRAETDAEDRQQDPPYMISLMGSSEKEATRSNWRLISFRRG